MTTITPASRYSSRYNTTAAAAMGGSSGNASSFDSTKSDPSSSIDQLHHVSSRALIKSNRNTTISTTTAHKTTPANFTSMVKKLVETKSNSSTHKGMKSSDVKLFVPADLIAQDLKKNGAKKNNGLGGLPKKLFKGLKVKKEEEGSSGQRKALTEAKHVANANTRTLAMVLRSERELLNLNKDQEEQILQLQMLLLEKNTEVEKLKDLCLRQREEIKSLKNSILFPDVMNLQFEELLEKQGSELKQAKQLIPSLQRQVTSLTGQLQCLAEDLAEVKAEKYALKGSYDTDIRSPVTPTYSQEDAANSLEFSSEDHTIPGSPDDMLLKDLNPCLTPYSNTKSKEFKGYESPNDKCQPRSNLQTSHKKMDLNSCSETVSKSSDCYQCSKATTSSIRPARRSDDTKFTYRKQMPHKFF